MITEKQTEAHVLKDGESRDSIGMSLDLDSAQMLMQMLSKNLYSDGIGSTVRECASNALDSHRRSGADKPIIVSFGTNREMNYEFSVEDFGTGLDADDVKNIISKYGKSTKRNSATELGMMGLGFKAPLAYSSSFYFVCRKDGMERKYMMYEGEDVNTIDLLYEAPTKEANGVKVIVPVKYNDRHDFVKKIKEQLAYFESVYFNVPEVGNDFLLYRSEHFQFSEISKDPNLHICLDNVYYPIDFVKLGISNITIPVGLKFGLSDGIFPTPNREAVRYTQESKKVILDKIKELANYFVDKYNETIVDSDDIKAVFSYYGSDSRRLTVGNSVMVINSITKFSDKTLKTPNLKGVTHINMANLYRNRGYILTDHRIRFTLNRGSMRDATKNYYAGQLGIDHIDDKHYYIYTGVIGANLKAYLKSILPSNETFSFVRKSGPIPLGDKKSKGMTSYYEILNLAFVPKKNWRACITEFQHIQSLYTKNFIDLDAITIPQSWFDARKKAKPTVAGVAKKLKMKGEIIGKKALNLERYVHDRNCKFLSETWKLENVENNKFLTVYTSHDDYIKLDRLYAISSKQKITYMTFSQRELNVLEKAEIHNLIPYSKFMEGKNKPFKRLVTSYLIHTLMSNYSSLFQKRGVLKSISNDLKDKLNLLATYEKANFHYTSDADKIYLPMVEVAEAHNLFDLEIFHIYKEIKHLAEVLPFLEPMMSNIYKDDEPMVDALADLLKYYKYRLNLERYNLVLNEEVAEKELTEEAIEELTN